MEINKTTWTVDDLLRTPFHVRARVNQIQIVAAGKSKTANQSRNQVVKLMEEKVPWLSHCPKRGTFFCWTCLLFKPAASVLRVNICGVTNATILAGAMTHECSSPHLESSLTLQMFIAENLMPAPAQLADRTQHNLGVKRNRAVLTYIIHAVCHVVACKHSQDANWRYSCNFLKIADCEKSLRLLQNFDKINVERYADAISLLHAFPKIANELVDAMTRVLKLVIRNEVLKSTYMSLMFSEHGSSKGKSQTSLVFRYIKRGKVCERFVGFTNWYDNIKVNTNNLEQRVLHFIDDILSQYGISDRFLALSVDGEVMPGKQLTNLLASVKSRYKFSYFVPWHCHGFGRVLLQSLSHCCDECGVFLKKLNAMESFFQNSKRFQKLEVILFGKDPALREIKWHLTSPFVSVVSFYRSCFVEFFDAMTKNWEAEDTAYAVVFRDFLLDLRTVLTLKIFWKLFSKVFDENLNFMQVEGDTRSLLNHPEIAQFREALGCLKLSDVWDDLSSEIDNEKPGSPLKDKLDEFCKYDFSKSFLDITHHLSTEMKIRCDSFYKMKFCDLLISDKYGNFQFRPDLTNQLMFEHGPFFHKEDLEKEMKILADKKGFKVKSVHELLERLEEFNFRAVFPQLYKLSEFVLTLPCLPASGESGKSKLRDIKNFSYIPQTYGIPSGEVSVLCVESDLLQDLKKSPLFIDDVLNRFLEVDQTLPLVQV